MVIKMSFVIEESFVKGKSLTSLCEDGWVATPDYVVVIDGATSKSVFITIEQPKLIRNIRV